MYSYIHTHIHTTHTHHLRWRPFSLEPAGPDASSAPPSNHVATPSADGSAPYGISERYL
jgi:hypothetical protein